MRKVERAIGQIAHRAGYDSPYAEDLKAPVEYESSDFSTNVTASNTLGAGCLSMVLNSVAHHLKARRQFVSISDNAHLLSESRRAMLFMEEKRKECHL